MLWANSADDKLMIYNFFLFIFPENRIDINAKLAPKKTVCICARVCVCVEGEGKKNKCFKMSSADFLPSMLSIKVK